MLTTIFFDLRYCSVCCKICFQRRKRKMTATLMEVTVLRLEKMEDKKAVYEVQSVPLHYTREARSMICNIFSRNLYHVSV